MNTSSNPAAQYQAAINNIMNLLGQQRADDAVSACHALMKSHPQSNDAYLLLGKAHQMQGRFQDMLKMVETALARDGRNIGLQLQFIGACQFCGDHDRALAQLALSEQNGIDHAAVQQDIAQLYVNSGKHSDAHRCFLRALQLEPNNSQYLHNLASSYIATGELQQAEKAYDDLIKRQPGNYEAWYNRSTLRKQTGENNHIRKLEKKLKKLSSDDARTTPICYTLAKELEDLGKDAQSFTYLKRGADSYRRRSNYDVQLDVSLMRRISEIFSDNYASNVQQATERPGPIFVLGLPRSGTTLVDRVLSSHSKVESLGEINDLALTLNRVGKSMDREKLLEACRHIDPDVLGRSYIESINSYGAQAPFVIDKTPTNYLYIGLLAKALPAATIVHVQRHPVDSCLSLYRALFRTGNPFSYDLNDLAEYYIAYDALMRHWQSVFPGHLHSIHYEDMVNNQEQTSRRLLTKCGLDWEPGCLDFSRNSAPVATASAAQVRQPLYRDALARWRRFEKQLTPLIERLQAAGIEI